MVVNTLSVKEGGSSVSRYSYRRGATATVHTPEIAAETTVQERHVSPDHCVTLPPGLIGSRVHRPAGRAPIGYRQTTVSQTLSGLPAADPEPTQLQMGGGDGELHPLQKTSRTILSICGQTNIRVYNRYVLCFPLAHPVAGPDARPRIDGHIRHSLLALAKGRPEFAGRLELAAKVEDHKRQPKSGYICLRQSPSFRIPFTSHALASEFGWSFSALRDEGFPAKAFVHPRFEIPCDVVEGGALPAAQVQALYTDGGLLLGVWLHHALADGSGVGEFLECFAAATRGDSVGVPRCLELDLMPYEPEIRRFGDKKSFRDIIDECPEYGIHKQLSNPTGAIERDGGVQVSNIEKTGRIFVFSRARLEDIKTAVNRHLRPDSSSSSSSSDMEKGGASCYACLAALTWAHVAKARLGVEKFAPDTASHEMAKTARLMNPVNWKPRALKSATRDYYGNATALAITKVPVPLLVSACEDESMEALARIVGQIKCAINSIDDEFVCRRLAAYYAAPDPRFLGLDIDPRTQQDLGFNTWREIGGDTEWAIPGAPLQRPESIRRAQGNWNMAGSLILPANKDSDVFELVVTLPKVSMERLLEDHKYTSKAIRIVE